MDFKIVKFLIFIVIHVILLILTKTFGETSLILLVGAICVPWKLSGSINWEILPIKPCLRLKKTQAFWFQISFSFLAITDTFFVENSLPAPVLKSTLQCGSNAILNLKIGWEITDLYSKMSEVAFYIMMTVLPLNIIVLLMSI